MKCNILFFVTEFWQAGTQRFTYEVDRAINKELFSVTILSYRNLNTVNGRDDYYYEKHKELRTEIYFLDDLAASRSLFSKKRKENKVSDFLDSFDVISIMGEYAYFRLDEYLNARNREKCVIHIMNTKHQHPSLYDRYDKSLKYTFCSGFDAVQIKGELEPFTNYKHYFFPLSIKLPNTEPVWTYPHNGTYKIGVFTRITKTKPLDPFLYAFHLLIARGCNAELLLYGHADEYKDTVSHMADYLGIRTKIQFKGHVTNMTQQALDDELNLVWFHSFYGAPGGFAGFDIASVGIPQLFWNFTPEFTLSSEFSAFDSMDEFTEHSMKLITDENLATSVSQRQFRAAEKTLNIENTIVLIEEMYSDHIKRLE